MTIKDKIFAADDLKRESVQVPEWDVTLYVRTMTGAERDAFEAETYQLQKGTDGNTEVNVNKANIRGRLLARVLVDETGARVFTDADADQLGRKSTVVLARLADIAQRVNAITKQDVEDLAKNS